MSATVYLIGAGPGDPGLITHKGTACIAAADVIVYDYLATTELLKYASPNAELIYAGKKGGDHTLTQDQINALLVEKASQGRTVARLKGGDPFIFGRGGEEIEDLIAAGIAYEIVPGVTSAIAAPAYAGIPMTHRQYASSVTFITGHEDPNKTESMLNWDALAKTGGTLVFLMGVRNLPRITKRLIGCGMSPETPAALVRWGTTPAQETVTGTLATINDNVTTAGLKPPCIIIVGPVVDLRQKMKWFENRPLFGKRIVVTRARKQASDMIEKLSALGAECLEYPVIRVVAPEDPTPMDAAIERLSTYHWIVFTSVNGVDAFFERLSQNGHDTRALGQIKTAAIGPATAARMQANGLHADIIPESYRAESVIAAFEKQDVSEKKILLPRAAEARPILPAELSKMGADVDEIAAYHTLLDNSEAAPLIDRLRQKSVDMVTFTSSSTVTNFKSLLPADEFDRLVSGVTVAAIGPITADTARENGFSVDVVAKSYTIDGLCEAIQTHFAG
ncbi:MAG: uroporphyrinogen-III C-methyltransferase [Thermodesulfobacteriota bacterium]